MFICVVGDIHGALNRMYDDIFRFEASLSIQFDWILHVGDFGIWPDPARIDRGARNHDGPGDFSAWLEQKRRAPRRTVFIKGNHEDFLWLDARRSDELLPHLIHLPNGHIIDLESGDCGSIRIGGVGGCYGPSDYTRQSKDLQGYAKRHYTQNEIEQLVSKSNQGSIDIVLTHDAPAGVQFPAHRRRRNYVSNAAGLDTLIGRVRPRVAFFGHHHTRIDAEIAGVRCIGLNKGSMPGNMVAIQMAPRQQDWFLLSEWPPRKKMEPT